MKTLQKELQQAVLVYVCHVKSAELAVDFGDCWKAMFPRRPQPSVPEWSADKSKDLLIGMRSVNDFADGICRKYEIQ